jgi:hypothetical protein
VRHASKERPVGAVAASGRSLSVDQEGCCGGDNQRARVDTIAEGGGATDWRNDLQRHAGRWHMAERPGRGVDGTKRWLARREQRPVSIGAAAQHALPVGENGRGG